MPKQFVKRSTLPPEVAPVVNRLGERISVARRRRGLRLVDLAKTIGVSTPTMVRIERGEPTVALGAYALALWALGLLGDFAKIADPSTDERALVHDLRRLPERVRAEKLDNDF